MYGWLTSLDGSDAGLEAGWERRASEQTEKMLAGMIVVLKAMVPLSLSGEALRLAITRQ